jgi:hypothetical protein
MWHRKTLARLVTTSFLSALVVVFTGCISRTVVNSDSQLQCAPSTAHHFDRILIVVLENQHYGIAIKDGTLGALAQQGTSFSNFDGLFHPSYPNYLAMIGGKEFEMNELNGDDQVDFPNDSQHRTIADLMTENGLHWKNYIEDYPGSQFLGAKAGRFVRRHAPFLSFAKNKPEYFANIVSVDPADPNNRFVSDVKSHALPEYSFYTPNVINDGNSSSLKTASAWLKDFLDNKFPPAARVGTLIVVTFDESQGKEKSNRIYTIFLGDMVLANNPATQAYNHYNVLRTVEDNFGLVPLSYGDFHAAPIMGIWK